MDSSSDVYRGYNIHSQAGLQECVQYSQHDPLAWLAKMKAAGTGTKRANMHWIRALRVLIQRQTLFMVAAPHVATTQDIITTLVCIRAWNLEYTWLPE